MVDIAAVEVGDWVTAVRGSCGGVHYTAGKAYQVRALLLGSFGTVEDDIGSRTNGWGHKNFRPSTEAEIAAAQAATEGKLAVWHGPKRNRVWPGGGDASGVEMYNEDIHAPIPEPTFCGYTAQYFIDALPKKTPVANLVQCPRCAKEHPKDDKCPSCWYPELRPVETTCEDDPERPYDDRMTVYYSARANTQDALETVTFAAGLLKNSKRGSAILAKAQDALREAIVSLERIGEETR
jgi:hypothetical protein